MGAHSLLMARFCSGLRRQGESVAIKDIYLNPTIEKLAQHLGARAEEEIVEEARLPLRIASDLEYYGCGALQLAFYLGYGSLLVWLLVVGFEWTYARIDDPLLSYARIVGFAFALFVLLSAIPIAAKWVLIGRFKKEAIPIWSLRYFRFWVVKTLIGGAPIVLFRGTPLYNLYLRLLGARIGANTVLRCRLVPVCTDLLSIGDNTILRTDCLMLGYKAQANYIYTGAIRIGDDAIVGEASVLDIDTEIGKGAQLGHSSSLQSGQRIPRGKRYHGSPALGDERRLSLRRGARLHAAAGARSSRRCSWRASSCSMPAFRCSSSTSRCPICSPCRRAFVDPQNGPELAVLALETLAVSFVLFFGALLRRLAARPRRAMAPPQAHREGQDLRPLRVPLLGVSRHRGLEQLARLQSALRRQRADRPLPALHRLPAQQGGADGLQFRDGAEARRSVPVRHRLAAPWCPTAC